MAEIFNKKLIDLLKTDSRFLDDEGELVKAAVIDRAWKIDRDLVKMLLSEPEIEKKFFDEIEGHWIFNINTFIEYMSDKNFLANSYTRFRNKIGLNIGGKFLSERDEVSLVWPYKDCVLEGGQTKEEEKRKEIFFNEILAQDEIDRLRDPKVFTNAKRIDKKGEQKFDKFKTDENGNIKDNLIIKGNNLLALHSLKKRFARKVKLIYIDPPYYFHENKQEDTFKYNSNFKLSSWLVFMKNRIEIAKELLSDKGAIFIQIDDNGMHYLRVLLDELFGIENHITTIAVKVTSESGVKVGANKPVRVKENILCYSKSRNWEYRKQFVPNKSYDPNYKYFVENPSDEPSQWKIKSIKDKFFEIYGSKNFSDANLYNLQVSYKNSIFSVRDISRSLKDKYFSLDKNKFIVLEKEDKKTILWKNGEVVFFSNKVRNIDGEEIPTKYLSDIWVDISWDGIAKEGGVTLKKGKKPEKLLKRIIDMSSNPDDIVLDFFVGTGTTCAVAHKMGRQFIGIEQLNYGKNDSVQRLKNVIGRKVKAEGEMFEKIECDQSGISKSVEWQGGGDFIYFELKKYNEAFMDKIQSVESSEELVELWKDIAENSFLNWYVNPEIPDEAIEDFIKIGKSENGLEKQKKLLAELLNKNQLYVNLSEIDDEDFGVSNDDKKLNQSFYKEL